MARARFQSAERGVFVALLVMGLGAEAVGSEPLPETASLANVRRHGWLQIRVSAGRLVFAGSPGVNLNHTGPATGERRERLSIRVTGSTPVVSYELRTPAQRFSLEVTAERHVHLVRQPQADRTEPVPVEFRQAPNEPITLTVGLKEHQHTYHGASLWHIFLAEPAVCRDHLGPLLRILMPEWDLLQRGEQIEGELVRLAASEKPPEQHRWAEWVRQLGDPQFSRREAADRQLREAGRVVTMYLERLDPAQLDAEQRYRVQRILQGLSETAAEESPAQVARWLAGDPAVWLALLARDNQSVRQSAHRHLEALLGKPVAFDPAADPLTRSRQIEAIRKQMAGQ